MKILTVQFSEHAFKQLQNAVAIRSSLYGGVSFPSDVFASAVVAYIMKKKKVLAVLKFKDV